MPRPVAKERLGIIGGLGAIAGADLFFKLVQATSAHGTATGYDILFEQRPFDEGPVAGIRDTNLNGRKLYIFDLIRQFERRGVERVMVPCFISHTFLDELQPELGVPIVDLMEALVAHVMREYPGPACVGVITSDYVRSRNLFERYFDQRKFRLVYPSEWTQEDRVMPAIYGPDGIKAGNLQGAAVDLLYDACRELLDAGADVIVPGATEIAIVAGALRARGIPIVDTNRAYVDFAISHEDAAPAKPFKIGIVGGVGPAATVDFMDKIIRNTDAVTDQEHVKLVVEHNPQIPDRTANLVSDGLDPTIAIYSACKRLEANGADLIAIPCNTAHAFVERIQPYLSIPIANMLEATADFICAEYGDRPMVGLLATSGTLASEVYHHAFRAQAIDMIVPDDEHQRYVMDAIYGSAGVKAGYTTGKCREDLMRAIDHLVERGAKVIVLGCTELPLVLAQTTSFMAGKSTVAILDPTEILARKCALLAHTAQRARPSMQQGEQL